MVKKHSPSSLSNPQRFLTCKQHFTQGLPLRVIIHQQKPDEIPHHHEFHEMVLVLEGRASHLTIDGKYPISRGNFYLVKPGQVHTYEDVVALKIVNILYHPEMLNLPLWDLPSAPGYHSFFEMGPRLRGKFRQQNGIHLQGPDLALIEARLRLMERLQSERSLGWRHAMTAEWMALLGQIAQFKSQERLSHPVDDLGRIFQYIEGHYPGTIRQKDLADCAGISVSKLQRLMKSAMAMSPMSALNQVRLEKAAERLRHEDASVGEIASAVGFNDSNYFSKLFSRAFGTTPRDYRKRVQSTL